MENENYFMYWFYKLNKNYRNNIFKSLKLHMRFSLKANYYYLEQFDPNLKNIGLTLKTFVQNLQQFGRNPKHFGGDLEHFGKNLKHFEWKSKYNNLPWSCRGKLKLIKKKNDLRKILNTVYFMLKTPPSLWILEVPK